MFGLDGVEHDADRFGELVEQRLMGWIEAFERGQLQDAFDLPFEDQRQHQHRSRRPIAQAGRDPDVIGGQVVEHDFLFLDGALSDDALAQIDLLSESLASLGGIAGQQRQCLRVVLNFRGRRTRPVGR